MDLSVWIHVRVTKKGQDTNRERAFMKTSDWDDMMMVIMGWLSL